MDFSEYKTFTVKFFIDPEELKRLEAIAEVFKQYVDQDGQKPFENHTPEKVFDSMMTLGSKKDIDQKLDFFERLTNNTMKPQKENVS